MLGLVRELCWWLSVCVFAQRSSIVASRLLSNWLLGVEVRFVASLQLLSSQRLAALVPGLSVHSYFYGSLAVRSRYRGT